MQNKTVLYGVGALIVLVLGIAAWMMIGGSIPGPGSQTPQTQNTTLKNLIAMGGSNKCTFTSSTQNTQSEGTVYVSGGQMRGDFTSTAAGKTTLSHMIVKENMSYMWSDAMPQGIKMSFDAMATQSDANPQASVDPNAQVEYSCSSWGADASVFVLPTDVTFQDMSAIIPNGVSGGAGAGAGVSGNSSQCSACDQIPDVATKAQCKAALSCK